jgi:hypothetical protein
MLMFSTCSSPGILSLAAFFRKSAVDFFLGTFARRFKLLGGVPDVRLLGGALGTRTGVIAWNPRGACGGGVAPTNSSGAAAVTMTPLNLIPAPVTSLRSLVASSQLFSDGLSELVFGSLPALPIRM